MIPLPSRLPKKCPFHQLLLLRQQHRRQRNLPDIQVLKPTPGVSFALQMQLSGVGVAPVISTATCAGERGTQGLMPGMKNADTKR